MPTPPKPFTVLTAEKKSHRTKKELNQRKQAEESLVSGTSLKERPEVKKNDIAHKEYLRVNKLLKGIEKNDALYEAVINRYCILQSECEEMEEKREGLYCLLEKLEREFELISEELDPEERMSFFLKFTKETAKLASAMINCDKQVQAKRRMLFDIEKENVMTIASALRSIPKKTETKKNALLEALGG